MNTELKRCPFCGGEANMSLFIGNHAVTCTSCMGMILPPSCGWTKEEAIKAWNTRKPMDEIVERLEEEKNCGMDLIDTDYAIEIVKKGGAI